MKFLIPALLTVCLSAMSYAQDYETTVEDIVFNSSSKIVIDEKTIKETKAPDLISLITTQANISLFNNNFQPPQLFLRGGDSSHLLFIIDGVPVYDVSWAQRTLNLNSLDINNVKRIEILKGGQTVLHGGQALVGVIKIETFGNSLENKNSVTLAGSLPDENKDIFNDQRLGISIEKMLSDQSAYKISARTLKRKNESPVLDSDVLYDQFNHNLDLAYENRGSTHVQMRGFWFKDKSRNPTTVNVMGNQSITDSDIQRQDEQTGLSTSMTFKELQYRPQLSLYAQKGWRYFYSDPTSQEVDAKFRSGLQGLLLNFKLVDLAKVKIKSGLSYQKEDYVLDDSIASLSAVARTADRFDEIRGVYTQLQWKPADSLLFETGFRIEKVTGFTEQNSYQVGLTLFDNTRLEWVTGYRAPSSSQRFGVFPNEDLKAETSQTYSATQDFLINDQGKFSATVFETLFNDYIETKSVGMGVLQYQNTSKVRTRGIETAGSFSFNSNHTVQMSYAYQDPYDVVRDETLRRRPRVTGTLRWIASVDQWGATLEGTGTGTRYDFFGTSRYQFPGYFLINSSLRYKLDPMNSFSLRVSNWLDTRSETSIDFYSEGRNMLFSWEHTF